MYTWISRLGFRLTVLATACLFVEFQPAFAQEEYLEVLGNGTLAKAKDEISNLIHIGVSERKLRLIRHWELERKQFTPERDLVQILERKIDENLEQGDDRREANRNALRELYHDFGFGRATTPPAVEAMQKVVNAASGGLGGSGGGSSGATWNRRLRGRGVSLYGTGNPNRIEFHLTETDDGAEVLIRQSEQGNLLFRYCYQKVLIQLRQEENEVQLVNILGPHANVYVARDLNELLKKHPRPVSDTLLRVWGILGIQPPTSFANKDVMDASIGELNAYEKEWDSVAQLIKDLEDRDEEVRSHTKEQLRNSMARWRNLVIEVAEDIELPKDARKTVATLRSEISCTRAHDYLDSINFRNQPHELVSLLEAVDEKDQAVVIRRLQQLTGETFGVVTEAWREYLNQSKEK